MPLPQDIKEVFCKTIKGDIAVADFEQWLYADEQLEALIQPEDRLELLSLDYRKSNALLDVERTLRKYISVREYEQWNLFYILHEAKHVSEKLPYILMEFYDMYCHGYSFLIDLGIGYGLAVVAPRVKNTTADTWEELPLPLQQELLDSMMPGLIVEVDKQIKWQEEGKIVLTGIQNTMGYYQYEDHRSAAEKISRIG